MMVARATSLFNVSMIFPQPLFETKVIQISVSHRHSPRNTYTIEAPKGIRVRGSPKQMGMFILF